MYKDWQRAPDRKTVVAGASAIFGIEDAGARATANAYLESEGARVEILYAWMIDRAAIEK
ncbi:hypothetical protein [Paraburkholderia caffeinitolerans]|uniref:hypothetical protein n=1 Tax=Paraburkholderia caffeinitolerans TaxID=1723730 RepID=UPI0015817FE2|nr:hypothetical protein [Paraburkholderia caffeinitolerans]